MATKLRTLVSKEKRRYQKNGYDLDLTYITDQVVAMGFPSEGREGVYRNPLKEIQRFLKEFHDGHYKIYNLCSERSYDIAKFNNAVECFPFDDHNAPTLEVLFDCCANIHEFLQKDKKNTVFVHCKAGKGRTGVMIACYLMYAEPEKWATEPAEVLNFYAAARTYNQKGVTIPSQIRFVKYFAELVLAGYKRPPEAETLLVKRILLTPWLPTLADHSQKTAKIVERNEAARQVGGVYAQFSAAELAAAEEAREAAKGDTKEDGVSPVTDASQIGFTVYKFRTLIHTHSATNVTSEGGSKAIGTVAGGETVTASERTRRKGSWLRRSSKSKKEKKDKKKKPGNRKKDAKDASSLEIGLDDLDLGAGEVDVDYTGRQARLSSGPTSGAGSGESTEESAGVLGDFYFEASPAFPHLEISPGVPIPVCGDTKIDLFVGDGSKPKEQRMCAFWFNTTMVRRRAHARECRRRVAAGMDPEPAGPLFDDDINDDDINDDDIISMTSSKRKRKWFEYAPPGGFFGECAVSRDGTHYAMAVQRFELDKALKDKTHFGDAKRGKSQGFRLILELASPEDGEHVSSSSSSSSDGDDGGDGGDGGGGGDAKGEVDD
jgi:protein-tyrosine phosphatase